MAKVAKIYKCNDCPECLLGEEHVYFYCGVNLAIIDDPFGGIPKWCSLPENSERKGTTTLNWKKSEDELPEIGVDVLGCNVDSRDAEMGFRCQIDEGPLDWIDFSFPVTHWTYFNLPE